MQLILKKADSGTNLLLFLYQFNKNLANTEKNELRLSAILQLMKLFDKNETAVRMALSRATKSGLFASFKEGNEVFYSPTSFGKEIIDKSVKKAKYIFKRYELRNSDWDEKWFSIHLIGKEGIDKDKRNKIVEILRLLGFSPMTENVWISPYDMLEDLYDLLDDPESAGHIVTMHGDLIVNENPKDFFHNVFKLEEYAKEYNDFIRVYEEKLDQYKLKSNDGQILESGDSVPLYFELGYSFFNISFQDSFLPQIILPEWEGEKAAALALKFFKLLSPSLQFYFNK